MAVRVPTFSKVRGPTGGIDAVVISWAGLLNGDTGTPVQRPDIADKTVQFEGTFGVNCNATIQGSNDSTDGVGGNWHMLSNPEGTFIAQGSAGIVQIMESTRWFRPFISSGDGTTNLTATVVARRSMRGG